MRKLLATVFVTALSVAPAWAEGTNEAYDKQCKSCHGADGSGSAEKAKVLKLDPAKLALGSAEGAKMSRDDVKKLILEGKAKMPAYAKKLKPEEVDPLVDHTMALIKARAEKK